MSVKPTTLPRWANVGGLVVVPPSGKQDVGHVPGERPPAQYENWIKNLSYQWLSYLNTLLTTGGGAADNIDTSGNAHFGGTLGIGGATTIGGTLGVTGNATLSGTLGVTGATTVGGTLGVTGDTTLSGNATLAANKNLKLQGTGYLQHGNELDLTPFTPGTDWLVISGSTPVWVSGGPYVQIPASTTVYYPLKVGKSTDRLQSVIVYGRAFVGAATLSLYPTSGMGTGAETMSIPLTLTGGGTTLSVAADGLYNPRTLTLQTAFTPTAGEILWLRVDVTAGNTAGLLSYGIQRDAP